MRYTYTQHPIPSRWRSDPALSTVDPLVLQILANRGFQDETKTAAFLFPDETVIPTQFSIKNLSKLTVELSDAIQHRRQIIIYHDYDVDGCCACAIMLENLNRFGAITGTYCNDRDVDGFGLCRNGVDRLLSKYPDAEVILTVDNGISAFDGIQYAKRKGLTVLVTDHHEPNNTLPDADVIVNCKQPGETYPFHEFCGAGLALKIMLALAIHLHRDPQYVFNSVDLAAFATIADVVPLIGENRAIVKAGTRIMNEGVRPFFRLLSLIKNTTASSKTIGFTYAPMVNAVSRMGQDVERVVAALVGREDPAVKSTVLWMDQLNEQRKALTAQQNELAKGLVLSPTPAAIVIRHPEFQAGLVGIIAGRLVDEYQCPAIVFAEEKDGTLKASARSIPGVNMKGLLDKLAPLLLRYGGHAMAAGLSIRTDDFEKFKESFLDLVKKTNPAHSPEKMLDAVVDADSLTPEIVQNLRILEPYGADSPEPLIGLNMPVVGTSLMGAEHQHVKYRGRNMSVIKWRGAEEAKRRTCLPSKFVGRLSLNEFNGTVSVQLIAE